VLGWWPLRAVGIVSYGLYLWHWPVQLFLADSPWWTRLGLAGAIAAASYVLVERPVRRGAWASLPAAVRPMVPVVAMSCVATVLVAATAAETPIAVRGDLGDRVRVGPLPRGRPSGPTGATTTTAGGGGAGRHRGATAGGRPAGRPRRG
jgi:hypothetical protein